MSRLFLWIRHHPELAKAISGALVGVLLVGGLAAGIHSAGRLAPPDGGLQTEPLVERIPASRHSVVGVVRAVRPGGMLVRNPRGVFFLVRWQPQSRVRAGGRAVRPAAVRVGDRVVVVGDPAADGTLHASLVTVVARPGATGAARATATPGGGTGKGSQ